MLKFRVGHWGHVQMLYFQCFRSFLIYIFLFYVLKLQLNLCAGHFA